jgi:hypothetical protein
MSEKKKVRIKLNTSLAGNNLDDKGNARDYFNLYPGSEVDWDADEAAKLVRRGWASYVNAPAAK